MVERVRDVPLIGQFVRIRAAAPMRFVEDRLGWDRLRALDLVRHVLEIAVGDVLSLRLPRRPKLAPGDRLPLEAVRARIGVTRWRRIGHWDLRKSK